MKVSRLCRYPHRDDAGGNRDLRISPCTLGRISVDKNFGSLESFTPDVCQLHPGTCEAVLTQNLIQRNLLHPSRPPFSLLGSGDPVGFHDSRHDLRFATIWTKENPQSQLPEPSVLYTSTAMRTPPPVFPTTSSGPHWRQNGFKLAGADVEINMKIKCRWMPPRASRSNTTTTLTTHRP